MYLATFVTQLYVTLSAIFRSVDSIDSALRILQKHTNFVAATCIVQCHLESNNLLCTASSIPISKVTLDLSEFNVNVMTKNNGAHLRYPHDPETQK